MNTRFSFSLDTLLLVVLAMSHLWFNPASNAMAVIGIAIYIVLDFVNKDVDVVSGANDVKTRLTFILRLFIVYFVIGLAVILPTGFNIIARLGQGPATYAHDGLIQTEEAIKFVLEGKNPYTEDYVDTPMADFPGREPPITDLPLYHNPYLPGLFVGSIPFYLASQALLGWYDQRIVYLLAYLATLVLLPMLVDGRRQKLSAIIAVGLNFLYAYYLADGRNDVMVLFGLVLTTVLLRRNHIRFSAAVLGMTVMFKHSAAFFLPFYFIYLWPPGEISLQSGKTILRRTWPLFVVVGAILLPFLWWDGAALLDDTVFHIIGTGDETLPIRGWGLSTLLLAFGIIPTPETSFPFIIFGLLFGIPTFIIVLRKQWQNNTLQYMWLGFALFSFVMQFFSRFFNDNYFVFLIEALVIGYFVAANSFSETNAEKA